MSRFPARSMIVAALGAMCLSPAALAIDDAHRLQAERMADRAAAYLASMQDPESGGWNVPKPSEQGVVSPALPAITALVVDGLLRDPDASPDDPVIKSGVDYILTWSQPDGGIYDRILPSYNTAIAVSALSRVRSDRATQVMRAGVDFLRGLQWAETADSSLGGDEAASTVDKSHPFYGGVGYGRHGRPDNSNLQLFLQAMHDAGVEGSDPAFQRALVFLSRTQMLDSVNDMPYADGSSQGGFVYATSVNRDSVGSGQSQVPDSPGLITETTDDGENVSRLRCYGSMTYAGFKSMLYADLARDDERVVAARDWLRRHFTVAENPNMGTDGYYYYLLTMARALDAWGEPMITVLASRPSEIRPEGAPPAGETRDWANDLVDRLATLQNPDGSFRAIDDRWMESDPVLITAYSLIALREAID